MVTNTFLGLYVNEIGNASLEFCYFLDLLYNFYYLSVFLEFLLNFQSFSLTRHSLF